MIGHSFCRTAAIPTVASGIQLPLHHHHPVLATAKCYTGCDFVMLATVAHGPGCLAEFCARKSCAAYVVLIHGNRLLTSVIGCKQYHLARQLPRRTSARGAVTTLRGSSPLGWPTGGWTTTCAPRARLTFHSTARTRCRPRNRRCSLLDFCDQVVP